MQNVITMVALLTLLGSPVAIAQTVGKSSAGPARPTVSLSLARDTRLVGGAPVGHRQPNARDGAFVKPSITAVTISRCLRSRDVTAILRS